MDRIEGMALGVGGCRPEEALAALRPMTEGVRPIAADEYRGRLEALQAAMRAQGVDACWLNAGSNLRYFTGLVWHPSERLVGALLPARGPLRYLAPWFEQGSIQERLVLDAPLLTWHEHESPYALLGRELPPGARLAVDASTPFFVVDGLRAAGCAVESGAPCMAPLRMRKSAAELALMQRAFDMTLAVQRAAASVLREGITTTEVQDFIDAAHRRVSGAGSSFCIVLFGVASSFPHGVSEPQVLQRGDVVLIDTGCYVQGYSSDLTRSYVYGRADEDVRRIWAVEKAAQAAAFAAARLGAPCSGVDAAARAVLQAHGLGPGYALPGLPHRTGHGIGLDIHEGPYLVGGDDTPLVPGMCFSNEPMIVLPGRFGIRLEDHFHMGADGPRWFTPPSHSLDDPFGLAA